VDQEKLFERPDQFLLAFEANDAVFVEMDRAAYHRSVFLDGRISPRSNEQTRLPVAALAAELDGRPLSPSAGYIYHVAHCGSTLLARALDLPESNIVLREPMALRRLGAQAATLFGKPHGEAWETRAKVVTTMLARRYAADGPAIVKANVPVNFMIPRMLEIAPDHPAIAIYFPLEDYLIAIMRSPNHRRWIENVTAELQNGITALTGQAPAGGGAETAALLWLAQVKLFDDLMARDKNAASLNAEDLFNRPKDTVAAAFKHFGQPQPDALVDRIVASELFARYSKNPNVAFTNAARLERKQKLRAELASELAQARALIERLPAARDLPKQLRRDLLGGGVDLLGAAS
jgi:hypothetical protein